jgi:hypothetical protein
MKIAFVGDSFCADIGKETWPGIVAKELDAKIIHSGVGGRHFCTSITNFLPKMVKTDIIICCVSDPYRIPNTWNDLPINLTWVEQMINQTGDHWKARYDYADRERIVSMEHLLEIANASDNYYKHLFDASIAETFQVSVVSFIDNLFLQHKKKVVWLPCFTESLKFNKIFSKIVSKEYIPISGPVASMPLYTISHAELIATHSSLSKNEINKLERDGDNRYNHLNKENNQNMANLIIDVIQNNIHEIKIEDYFSHLNLKKVKIWPGDGSIPWT